MSFSLFPDDVLFFQRVLHADGLYLAFLDGNWGPKTEKAVQEFEKKSDDIRLSTRTFDGRSERNILSLSLKAQREARLFLGRLIDGRHECSHYFRNQNLC